MRSAIYIKWENSSDARIDPAFPQSGHWILFLLVHEAGIWSWGRTHTPKLWPAHVLRAYVKFLLIYEVYLWLQVFTEKLYFWSSMSLSFFKSYFIGHFPLFAGGKLTSSTFSCYYWEQYKLKFDYFIYISKTYSNLQKIRLCLWPQTLIILVRAHRQPWKDISFISINFVIPSFVRICISDLPKSLFGHQKF